MKPILMLACGAMLGLSASGGTLINTYPDGPGNFTNNYLKDAQTFLAPADNVLSSFQFTMFNGPGQSAQLQIFAWGANGPTGGALFTSQTFLRTNSIQDFLVSNMNLALTQGSLYGAVIDNFGYGGQNAEFNLNQNSYTGGNLWLISVDQPTTWNSFAGLNLTFQANFVNTVVPTVSGTPEPGALLLSGFGLIGLILIRRRFRTS